MRASLCNIKDVPGEILRLLRGEDLHLACPGRGMASLDGSIQITRGMIRVFPRDTRCFLPGKVLNALIRLEVILHPEGLAPVVIPFIGVAGVAIHVTEGGWRGCV